MVWVQVHTCHGPRRSYSVCLSMAVVVCVPLVEHVWRCVAVARLTTSICVVLVQIHITTEDRDSWLKNATVAVFFQDAQSFLHNPLFGRDRNSLPSRNPNVKLTDDEDAFSLQTVCCDRSARGFGMKTKSIAQSLLIH